MPQTRLTRSNKLMKKRASEWLAVAGAAVLFCGCATRPQPVLKRQVGESVAFIGADPAALAYLPSRSGPLRVRSTYQPGPGTVEYVEGRDFSVDYSQGTLRRTEQSLLPDFRTNLLYGQADFDHTRFPGFGNGRFFAFVDYSLKRPAAWPVPAPQTAFLRRTQAKLAAGAAVTIVAFGDSITAGGDATKPELIFWNRWATELRAKYPAAKVVAENGATGGDSTVQGLQRLQAKVLDRRPDLVLIGFGMNDHNVSGVPIPQFAANLRQMVERIRKETLAEVVLFSAFPPNPKWKFGSHHMADYAEATERVARETACAYADVFHNWEAQAARKKPEDILGNNINHPNDFGHWIYYRTLSGLGL